MVNASYNTETCHINILSRALAIAVLDVTTFTPWTVFVSLTVSFPVFPVIV